MRYALIVCGLYLIAALCVAAWAKRGMIEAQRPYIVGEQIVVK